MVAAEADVLAAKPKIPRSAYRDFIITPMYGSKAVWPMTCGSPFERVPVDTQVEQYSQWLSPTTAKLVILLADIL